MFHTRDTANEMFHVHAMKQMRCLDVRGLVSYSDSSLIPRVTRESMSGSDKTTKWAPFWGFLQGLGLDITSATESDPVYDVDEERTSAGKTVLEGAAMLMLSTGGRLLPRKGDRLLTRRLEPWTRLLELKSITTDNREQQPFIQEDPH